ncbi:MAG TPA: hypothetical protein VGM90_23670 [Kofleriaceae bacterium]
MQAFRRFLALLALVPVAAPAIVLAQPVTAPRQVEEPSVSISILDPDHALDAAAVQSALAAELGVKVVSQGEFSPSLGRLEVAVEQGELRIAYHPAAGTMIERTMALPIAPDDRLQLITFVTSNLVKDQASEVINGLPEIPPPAAPVLLPRDTAGVRHMPFSIGLVWPISLDRIAGERVIIDVGLYGIAGYADSSTVASISGVADVKRNTAGGAQLAGVASIAGNVEGAQIGGVLALSKTDLNGMQIAGVASFAGRNVDGLQLSGVSSVSRGHVHGGQIAGVANIAESIDGAQLGTVNIGGDVSGAQIGVVNVARKMKGLQLGVVNVSDDGDDSYPIGLINYSRNGGIAIDVTADSSRVESLSLRHGTKHIHNVWSVGWSPDYDHILVGAGLGFRVKLAEAIGVDIDAMHWLTNVSSANVIPGAAQIDQLKATVGFPVAKNLEVFGGVAANVYVTDGMDESDKFHATGGRKWLTNGGTTVALWPSAFAGIRVRAL